MAGNRNRALRQSERPLAFFTTEKGRDRAAAERSIEHLGQNDQIIALLHEQNQMLRYLCDLAFEYVSRQDRQDATAGDAAAEPRDGD